MSIKMSVRRQIIRNALLTTITKMTKLRIPLVQLTGPIYLQIRAEAAEVSSYKVFNFFSNKMLVPHVPRTYV